MPITTDIMSSDKPFCFRKPNVNERLWCEKIKSLTPNVEEYPATISVSNGFCYTDFDIEIPRHKDVPIALSCRHCWEYVPLFREHSPEGVAIALDGEKISIASHSSSERNLVHDCTHNKH